MNLTLGEMTLLGKVSLRRPRRTPVPARSGRPVLLLQSGRQALVCTHHTGGASPPAARLCAHEQVLVVRPANPRNHEAQLAKQANGFARLVCMQSWQEVMKLDQDLLHTSQPASFSGGVEDLVFSPLNVELEYFDA